MFMTAVSLAVAAIPEGLAAVSTIVLAIGVQRMVKKNAIVKKLPAVETLGSATVICSDKTGTLTQNKMTVQKVFADNKLVNVEDISNIENSLEKLMYTVTLCNDTKIGENNNLTGDPTETALIDLGFKIKFDVNNALKLQRVKEYPFDSDRKLMTTVNKVGDKYIAYTKGGIDELLAKCTRYELEGEIKNNLNEYRETITKYNIEMAQDALRVLAMAYKELDHEPTDEEMKNIENDLIFVGMVGMIDPPREEVKLAVEKCKTAGIKTVMITGDHKITATAIAKKLGILENDDEAITGLELEQMTDEIYRNVEPEDQQIGQRAEVQLKNGDVINPNAKEPEQQTRETRQNNFLLRDLIRILLLREWGRPNRPPVRPPFPPGGGRPPMSPGPGMPPPNRPPRPPMGPPPRPRYF